MSAATTSLLVTNSSSSSKEFCSICQEEQYNIICICGDKFCFTCIHVHVAQMTSEFQYLQNTVGERLLQVEQIVEDNSCTNLSAIVENWRRKRIDDINNIADTALNLVSQREKAYVDLTPCRTEFNSLCQETNQVTHEQLDAMIKLQQQIFNKSEELQTLPEFPDEGFKLDSQLQSRLNQNQSIISLSNILSTDTNNETNNEPIISYSKAKLNKEIPIYIELNSSISTTTSNESSMNTFEPVTSPTTLTSEQNLADNIKPNNPVSNENISTDNEQSTEPLSNNNTSNNNNESNSTAVSTERDEFEAGQTVSIDRRNPTIIRAENDKYASTVCCYDNQLIYNDFNSRNRTTRITFIPDITQLSNKQTITWEPPEVLESGGDDDWIQDIAYSTKLNGYLLLNRARLRFLPRDTQQLEEYLQFSDRSMKRIACNGIFMYLVIANGVTSQNGDEIVLYSYDKIEVISKTFRELILRQNNLNAGALIGEFSDIAVNPSGQLLSSYRYQRREEVGVYMFNITNDGKDWTIIKRFLLNECWHPELSYTPRLEWCEKLNVYFLIEYMTSHLIILDLTGRVKGETRFSNAETRRDGPLNLSISNNDWLSVRYGTSINIHRIDDDRL